MIVKILSASRTFNAVRYNTDKIDRNHGELMKIRNFGLIGNGMNLKPQEVKNYLAAFSMSNPRVSKPQFHATISCKGREAGKDELTELSEKWLIKMGYGENPYLIVFHSDTPNNHVHIVSTRVGINGRKINDQFEKRRAQEHLRALVNKEQHLNTNEELVRLETYQFKTLAQFRLLLEKAGFRPVVKEGQLQVYYQGKSVKSYPVEELTRRMTQTQYDEKRLLQLQAILNKYRQTSNCSLIPDYRLLPGGRLGNPRSYSSELTRLMHQKFGLEFVFHFKENKAPYGYTVIDHVGKQVLKGSELMKLALLVDRGTAEGARIVKQGLKKSRWLTDYRISSDGAAQVLAKYLEVPYDTLVQQRQPLNSKEQSDYRHLLQFLIGKKGSAALAEHGLLILTDGEGKFLLDTRRRLISELNGVLSREESSRLTPDNSHFNQSTPAFTKGLVITADQDDELVYGRRRRGKKPSRDR